MVTWDHPDADPIGDIKKSMAAMGMKMPTGGVVKPKGAAVAKVKEKLAALSSASQEADEAMVGLAVHLGQPGVPNPDWDPLEHPKDHEGKFVKKHTGGFLWGKSKTAHYQKPGDKEGFTTPVTLEPGQQLAKVHFKGGLAPSTVVYDKTTKTTKTASAGAPIKGAQHKAVDPDEETPSSVEKVEVLDEAPGVDIDAADVEGAIAILNDPKGKVVADIGNSGKKIVLEKNEKLYKHMAGGSHVVAIAGADGKEWVTTAFKATSGSPYPPGGVAAYNLGKSMENYPESWELVADGGGTKGPQPDKSTTSPATSSDLPEFMAVDDSGQGTFTHPGSGAAVKVAKGGEGVYQHKASPKSFLVDIEGEGIKFFDKNGTKKNASQFHHLNVKDTNYTKVFDPAVAQGKTDPIPQYGSQFVAPEPTIGKPDTAPEPPLADWEKELLAGFEDEWNSPTPKDGKDYPVGTIVGFDTGDDIAPEWQKVKTFGESWKLVKGKNAQLNITASDSDLASWFKDQKNKGKAWKVTEPDQGAVDKALGTPAAKPSVPGAEKAGEPFIAYNGETGDLNYPSLEKSTTTYTTPGTHKKGPGTIDIPAGHVVWDFPSAPDLFIEKPDGSMYSAYDPSEEEVTQGALSVIKKVEGAWKPVAANWTGKDAQGAPEASQDAPEPGVGTVVQSLSTSGGIKGGKPAGPKYTTKAGDKVYKTEGGVVLVQHKDGKGVFLDPGDSPDSTPMTLSKTTVDNVLASGSYKPVDLTSEDAKGPGVDTSGATPTVQTSDGPVGLKPGEKAFKNDAGTVFVMHADGTGTSYPGGGGATISIQAGVMGVVVKKVADPDDHVWEDITPQGPAKPAATESVTPTHPQGTTGKPFTPKPDSTLQVAPNTGAVLEVYADGTGMVHYHDGSTLEMNKAKVQAITWPTMANPNAGSPAKDTPSIPEGAVVGDNGLPKLETKDGSMYQVEPGDIVFKQTSSPTGKHYVVMKADGSLYNTSQKSVITGKTALPGAADQEGSTWVTHYTAPEVGGGAAPKANKVDKSKFPTPAKDGYKAEKGLTSLSQFQLVQGKAHAAIKDKIGLKKSFWGNEWSYTAGSPLYQALSSKDAGPVLAALSSLKADVGQAAANMDQAYPESFSQGEKAQWTKEKKRFIALYQMSTLAQMYIDADPKDETAIKELSAEVAEILGGSTFPMSSDFPMSKASLATVLGFAHKKWEFTNSLTDLPFSYSDASVDDITSLATEKGFPYVGGLTDATLAKKWLDVHLGAPNHDTMVSVESEAKFNIASASAAVWAEKNNKASQPTQGQLDADVAEKAALTQAKNLYQAYMKGSGSSLETLGKKDDGTWVHAIPPGTQNTITHAQAVDLIQQEGWKPLGELKHDKNKSFASALYDFQSENGPVSALSPSELNKHIKAFGGNYVGKMDAETKQKWLMHHFNGDEVAKWALEKYAAEKGTGGVTHKDATTHPGSPMSPGGKVARQMFAEFMASNGWWDGDPTHNPFQWPQAWSLDDQKVDAAFKVVLPYSHLTQPTQQAKPNPDDMDGPAKRVALHAWFNSYVQSGGVPQPSSQPVAKDAIKKPVDVPDNVWNFVLAAEEGDSGVAQFLKDFVPASDYTLKGTYGIAETDIGFIPESVKRLAMWAYDEGEYQYQAALKARYQGGAYIPGDASAWITPKGDKKLLPPGAQVWTNSNNSLQYMVIGQKAHPLYGTAYAENTAYITENNGYTKMLEVPADLNFVDAKADGLTVGEFAWDAVAEMENTPPNKLTLPGTHYDPANLLYWIKDSGGIPQTLKDSAPGLPLNVQKMILWASSGDPHVLKVIEYKNSKGYYQTLATKKLLSPNASYAPMVMSGKINESYIGSTWTPQQIDDLAADLGITSHKPSVLAAELAVAIDPAKAKAATLIGGGLPDDPTLTKISKTLGGMHSKQAWTDEFGNEWMTKAFPNDPNSAARIDAEDAANKIGLLFGFHQPKTLTKKVDSGDGPIYSYVQHLKPANGNLSGKTPADLSDTQLSQAMSEHVLDWLISNHDSHPENLLLDPNGKDIIGIDKGQAWRFFPDDQLAVGYHASNPVAVWYDEFYYAVQNNSITKERADMVARAVMTRAIKMQKNHDDAFSGLLDHAFESRTTWPDQHPSREAFKAAVMDRKANLVKDFEKFYSDLYKKAGYKWDIDVEALSKAKVDDHTHVSVTQEFADDIMKGRTHGKALMFDSADLEDAHMLFFTTKAKGGKTTSLKAEARLRKDADAAIVAWLKAQTVEDKVGMHSSTNHNDPWASTIHQDKHKVMPNNDVWFSQIVAAAKTVNTHSEDGQYNQSTLNTMATAKAEMQAALDALVAHETSQPDEPLTPSQNGFKPFVTKEQQDAWKTMLSTYVDHINKIESQKAVGGKVKPHFEQYQYEPSEGLTADSPFLPDQGSPAFTVAPEEAPEGATWTFQGVNGDTTEKFVKVEDGLWKFLDEGIPVGKAFDQGHMVDYIKTSGSTSNSIDVSTSDVKITGQLWTAKTGPTLDHAVQFVLNEEDDWYYEYKDGALTGVVYPAGDLDAEGYELADEPDSESVTVSYKSQQEESGTAIVNNKTVKVTYKNASGIKGDFDLDTGITTETGTTTQGYSGYHYYVEFDNVTIEYMPHNGADVALAQQGLLRVDVKEWDGDTQEIEEVLSTLNHMGLNLDEATEESLELFYWRHLYGVVQDRYDPDQKYKPTIDAIKKGFVAKGGKLSPGEELALLKESWALSMGQDAVDNADYLPKFDTFTPHEGAEFTSGKPHWHRPDFTIADIKKYAKGFLPGSTLGNQSHAYNVALSGYLPSEERLRLTGSWNTGGYDSQGSDQNNGASGFVFTRQNMDPHSFSGSIYYHPRTLLRTSNYAFTGDNYGNTHLRKDETPFDLSKSLGWSQGGNETMMKNGVGLSDIAVIKFANATDRANAIKAYEANGITELNGVDIQKVFVLTDSEAKAAHDLVWDAAIEEEKAGK